MPKRNKNLILMMIAKSEILGIEIPFAWNVQLKF